MKEYKYAVFIGRFQPLHNAHLEVIKHGLEIADKVIVVVGSIGAAPNIKNPFPFKDRKQLILDSIAPVETEVKGNTTVTTYSENHDRVIVLGVRDYYYNDNIWVSDIQAKTDKYIQEGDSVALLGDYKDGSSYYLKYFPQWEFKPIKSSEKLDATEIRNHLFSVDTTTDWTGRIAEPANLKTIKNKVPAPVYTYLETYIKSYEYKQLCEEFAFTKEYKNKWKSAPFPPTFVTVDAVVVCSGHVLVVKRKFAPGEGLIALPGGFIRGDERIKDAAIRELKEETGIRLDKIILQSSVVDAQVFDHPSRSLRGRTITHGFYIRLKDGKLPEVKGNDDAAQAFWMPLMDVAKYENKFYEDHAHIINYFVNKM